MGNCISSDNDQSIKVDPISDRKKQLLDYAIKKQAKDQGTFNVSFSASYHANFLESKEGFELADSSHNPLSFRK